MKRFAFVVIAACGGASPPPATPVTAPVATPSPAPGPDAPVAAPADAPLPALEEMAVFLAYERTPPERKRAFLERLAVMAWDAAQIASPMRLPTATQITAKDVLVLLRGLVEDDQLAARIEGQLVEWYGVESYDARATVGSHLGAAVARNIGPAMAAKLLGVLDGIVARPPLRVGDELLLGLAAAGSADAVGKLLALARPGNADATLAARSLSALYRAYVEPANLFKVQSPDSLAPHADALAAIAKDGRQQPVITNNAIALLGALGPPRCVAPLVGMIGATHPHPRFKLVVANQALRCGGAGAIARVVRALPAGPYAQDELAPAIAGEIAKLPHEQAIPALRELLADKSVVVRWVAIEALAALKSTDDKARIAALAKSTERLRGYWGDVKGRPEPTLGQRAKQLADAL